MGVTAGRLLPEVFLKAARDTRHPAKGSPDQTLEQQRGEFATAVQYTEDIHTIDIKPVDDAPRSDDDLSVRERAELLQLWDKASAFREEGELFRGRFKAVEDGKRVFNYADVMGRASSNTQPFYASHQALIL
ncbi:MAG: hypothetical protein ACREVH_05685 [Gammaproteobacteria bacterium]